MQNEQLEFSNKFVINSLVKGKKLIGVFSDSETSSNGGVTLERFRNKCGQFIFYIRMSEYSFYIV